MLRNALLLLALANSPFTAQAQRISFDKEEKRIQVTGYPEEAPATLSDILVADEKAGWEVMKYDEETETFTLHASLWIGSDEDYGTFFQIGRPTHPRETLVLHGDLQVNPPRASGQRYDRRYLVSNRLTLGDPERPEIRPTVIIACSHPREFSVNVPPGPRSEEDHFRPLGDWFMFHGELRAADPENPYNVSISLSHAGINYHIADSSFSDWSRTLLSYVITPVLEWMPEAQRALRGMRFENGDQVTNGSYLFVDSLFRNVKEGTARGNAIRCRFEGNRENFRLPPSHTGVVFTDCIFGDPEEPPSVPRSNRNENWLRNYSVYKGSNDFALITNPGVIERSSIQVRVVDESGQPVQRAIVLVEAPQDASGLAVEHPLAVTNAEGLTPGDAEEKALVLTTQEWRPTDDPLQPEHITHTYRLRVEAKGFQPHEMILESADEIPRPLTVTLQK